MSSLDRRAPGASREVPRSAPRLPSESGASSQEAAPPDTPPYSSGVGQYQAGTPVSGGESTGSSRKIKARERVKVACNHCRSRKIKCDAERPFCTGCVRGKRTCSYDEAKGRGRDRQPRQSRIRHLLRAESSDSELGPYQHQQGANDYPNDGGESSSYTPQEQARHPLQGDEQVHEGWGWSNAHSSGSTYGHQHQVNYYRDQPHSSSHTIGDNDPFGVNPRSLSYNSMSRYNSHVLDPDTSPPHSAATLPPRRSPEPSPAILHPSTSIDLIPRIRPSRSEKPNMTALP